MSTRATALFGLDGFKVLACAEAGGELSLLVQTTANLVGCPDWRGCHARLIHHPSGTVSRPTEAMPMTNVAPDERASSMACRPQRRAPGPGPPDLRPQRPVRRRRESAPSSRRQVAPAVAVEAFDDDVEPPQDLPEQPNDHLAVAGRHEGLRVRGLNGWFG